MKEYKRIKRYPHSVSATGKIFDEEQWDNACKQWSYVHPGDIVQVQLAKGEVFAVVCEGHMCSKCVLCPCVEHYGMHAKCCVPLEDIL